MLNEFVYCQRLFYYEFVEGVFVESVDTLRGEAIHKRVDSGSGALPKAKRKSDADKPKAEGGTTAAAEPASKESETKNAEPETIHSRSVQMGSERLGVVAKMDLVETKTEKDDLFTALEVCPVDYKAGAPKEGGEANELWDTDKMQLGLQALILRDNGYTCNEGVIYYRATKQRVRLPITPELENWILQNIAEARRVVTGPIPAPLVHSPKCVRCSLAPVCLPDETRMLAQTHAAVDLSVREKADTPSTELSEDSKRTAGEPPRRLIAARDDTRPLYLNTQGYRVGCKDEVLTVKEKDRVVEEVRMRDLSHVALFGNIQISTQAIQSLCELEIPVTYFSMGGWFYGITRGHALKNVFLRMEQFR
ncbi:MAG TPA: CRISPR-associated protein Cas4, partial [Candidatus Saccharimonadales bacterium]|nr:CRISPR-associated protein Cas4 [Candidatus Saccharimonadales bacterium]